MPSVRRLLRIAITGKDKTIRRTLYPRIEPYHSEMLPVSGGHTLYVECSGNPDGHPVIFLHGGPGGATAPDHRRFFDPTYYNIILFDQRGCGKSRPHASLEHNTTWDLVADIETIRHHFNVDRWMVFGGSWGSTLALAYAIRHPEPVTELVLRGIYTIKQDETDWLMKPEGAAVLFPDEWEKFIAPLNPEDYDAPLEPYYQRLTSKDDTVRQEAALAFSGWEQALVHLIPPAHPTLTEEEKKYAEAIARLEAHYFINKGWMAHDDELLEGARTLSHIPTHIVHGRYDVVCPMRNAWRLYQNMPHAKLKIIPDAGHSAFEPGIVNALVNATDFYRKIT